VILGMCNPISSDPGDALEPHTANGAGERLWKILCEVHPVSREEYVARFDLMNIVQRRDWSTIEAKTRATEIRSAVAWRPTVILGRQVWSALGLHHTAWFGKIGHWWLAPHPSGRNPLYNDPEIRQKTGELLATLGGWRKMNLMKLVALR